MFPVVYVASQPVSGYGNGTYAFYVVACNAAGCSGNSATASKTVLLPPGIPGTSHPSPNSVYTQDPFTLTWSTASGTVQYYIINGGATHYTGLSANLTAPRTGGSYHYYVQGCNTANGAANCGPNGGAVPLTVTIDLGGCKTCAPVNGGSSTHTTTTAAPLQAPPLRLRSTGGAPMASVSPTPGISGDALQPVLVAASVPVSELPLLELHIKPVAEQGVLVALAHTPNLCSPPASAGSGGRCAGGSQPPCPGTAAVYASAGNCSGRGGVECQPDGAQRLDPRAPAFAPPVYIA